MSNQYRKLQKKVHPQAPKPAPKPKVGKDYFLVGVIFFTALILLIGWQSFGGLNIAMYILLLVSLSITYARRHAKLTEERDKLLERVGIVSTLAAVALFAVNFYYQFIA